jgi:HTH-type transcriptional regulator/antitoxin HigA
VITNDVQYRSTLAWVARFDADVAMLEMATPAPRSRLQQAKIDATRSQADDLRGQVEAYEALRSGAVRRFEAGSLLGLAEALVMARVARGWTQRRLADELGVAEQQIQRYEATGYASASLARLAKVATALGVTITETVTLDEGDAA